MITGILLAWCIASTVVNSLAIKKLQRVTVAAHVQIAAKDPDRWMQELDDRVKGRLRPG